MAKQELNFRQYWDAVGTENIMKIIDECESSLPYFRALRYGIKKPSAAMALAIIRAAEKHTAPYVPDLALMVQGVPRAGQKPDNTIRPSPAFIRSRQRRAAKEAPAGE